MTLLADPWALAVVCLAVVIVGLAKGGFAGLGALATPLLALALPPASAAALLLPILIVQDVVSVWAFRDTWNRWIIAWMLPGGIIGVALGWAFAARVDEVQLLLALGGITLLFGAYRLWVERGGRLVTASTSPGWVGSLFGVATGVASQIAHAGGPPFQMWVTPRRMDHRHLVGTQAVLFAALNWIKVPTFVALGALDRRVLTTAAVMMPLAIASTLAGVWLIRRMDTGRFYTMVYMLMIVLGSKLIWDGLSG